MVADLVFGLVDLDGDGRIRSWRCTGTIPGRRSTVAEAPSATERFFDSQSRLTVMVRLRFLVRRRRVFFLLDGRSAESRRRDGHGCGGAWGPRRALLYFSFSWGLFCFCAWTGVLSLVVSRGVCVCAVVFSS
ncbi:hypothetical protein ACQJBY_004342 [Aegilops geniculata]